MKINILKRVYAFYILAIILISSVTNTNAQNTYLELDTTDNLTTSLPKEIINTNGSNFVEIQYHFPGAFVTNKSVDDDVYNYIHIDGFGKMGQVGKPALPAYHNIVTIPENT